MSVGQFYNMIHGLTGAGMIRIDQLPLRQTLLGLGVGRGGME